MDIRLNDILVMKKAHPCIKSNMGRVGLGRRGHQHGGISQRDPGLRHTQLQCHFHTGVDNGNDLGIGKTDILRCDHHHIAFDAALADVRAGKAGPIPRHLQNVHADTYTIASCYFLMASQ